MLVGNGDEVYVIGIFDVSVEKWYVFCLGKLFKDLEFGEVIVYEVFFFGYVYLVKLGELVIVWIV